MLLHVMCHPLAALFDLAVGLHIGRKWQTLFASTWHLRRVR